jgi:hypothetical protein
MRILGVLVALQCAGIAFLVYRSLAVQPTPGAATSAMTSSIPAAASGGAFDEERLRQVIREELAALPAPGVPGAQPAIALAPRDAERDRAQREQVAAQIAHYRSVGHISEAEMQGLQHDIAQLDPVARKEMLAALVRAMNAREIKGQM